MEGDELVIAQQYLDYRSREEIEDRAPYLEGVSVCNVGLPIHTYVALRKKGVEWLIQLLPYSEKELSREFRLGPRSAGEIVCCMKSFLGVEPGKV